MKTTPKTDAAEDVRGDSATFTEFMRKLVQVPHAEIKAAMEADQELKRASGYAFRGRRAGEKRLQNGVSPTLPVNSA